LSLISAFLHKRNTAPAHLEINEMLKQLRLAEEVVEPLHRVGELQ